MSEKTFKRTPCWSCARTRKSGTHEHDGVVTWRPRRWNSKCSSKRKLKLESSIVKVQVSESIRTVNLVQNPFFRDFSGLSLLPAICFQPHRCGNSQIMPSGHCPPLPPQIWQFTVCSIWTCPISIITVLVSTVSDIRTYSISSDMDVEFHQFWQPEMTPLPPNLT